MKVKVLQMFHDGDTMALCHAGTILDWEDSSKIEAAEKRGLIKVVEEVDKKPDTKKPARTKKKK